MRVIHFFYLVLAAPLVLALGAQGDSKSGDTQNGHASQAEATAEPTLAKASFAGGCFWCVESDFDEVEGVVSTTSGYIGGTIEDPTYQKVSSGSTGHAEAVLIEYDPTRVRYSELLEIFWHTIDPTTKNAQFCDHGAQYRTAIFPTTDEQLDDAKRSKVALEASKPFAAPIVTEIETVTTFYPAEEYHQDYYKKNPLRYQFYRSRCGRDARLKKLWGDQAISH
jgi:peptide-methionine (S)-S-oxide reductase